MAMPPLRYILWISLVSVQFVIWYTECAGEMSRYGTAFSVEYRVFLEDFTLQGCGAVLLNKHPVFHRLVVHSAWTAWSWRCRHYSPRPVELITLWHSVTSGILSSTAVRNLHLTKYNLFSCMCVKVIYMCVCVCVWVYVRVSACKCLSFHTRHAVPAS
jgi:hypothetical protein